MIRHTTCDIRTTKLLILFLFCLVLPQAAQAATYYVATDGNNSYTKAQAQNIGTPWKTINYGARQLAPGDTLLVRGGVYRENVNLAVSGTETERITIKNYPGEKPIIDGSEVITGWTKCTSQAECLGNPNWSNIYYADIPSTTSPFHNIMQQEEFLRAAQYPNPNDNFYITHLETYLDVPKAQVGTNYIIDDRLESFGGASLIGSYVMVWHSNNQVGPRKILDYIPSEHKIIIEEISPSYDPTKYSIANHYNGLIFESEGEYYLDESTGGATKRLYVWPLHGVSPQETEITRTAKGDILCFGGSSYITIEGFIFQRSLPNSIIYTQWHGIDYGNIIRNNEFRWSSGIPLRNNGIWLLQSKNFLVENNHIHHNRGFSRGVTISKCEGEASPEGVIVRNNDIHDQGGDGIQFFDCINGAAINNYIHNNAGTHAGGIKAYAGGKNILLAGNKIIDSPSAIAFQLLENLTMYNNIVINGEVSHWTPMLGKLIMINNYIDGPMRLPEKTDPPSSLPYVPGGVIFKNNIFNPSLMKPYYDYANNNLAIDTWQAGYQVGHIPADRSLIFKNSPKILAGAIRNPTNPSDLTHLCIASGYFSLIHVGDYLIHEADGIPRTIKSVSVGWFYGGNYYTKIEVNEPFTELKDGKIQIWEDISNLNIDLSIKNDGIAVDQGVDASSDLPIAIFSSCYDFYKDINGNTRPQGAGWDIGPFEGPSIIYGDVSGDGIVNAYDAALVAQAAVGLRELTPEQAIRADVSGEGIVSAYDAALIAQYVVGLRTEFPAEG